MNFKKILIAANIVCASHAATGQQPMNFMPVSNLDMMISNIFGIQCDGVSNVQLFAVPIQVGRFENGTSFGLNSGLVLSTGVVQGSEMPSGMFNSIDFGTPGDNDIAQFGSMAGQNPSNFDACRVEFDFSPSITDTIRFTYILASEEYPEYSMSSYTDRFLFLVSENGGPYSNIAYLPGSTTTTVEINSVNQFINPQYFIDNSGGANASNFVFDGYTTPFEAKFHAQIGSTYHIKLVIADVNDDVYDSAIFLDEQETYNDISGSLTVNGAPAEGILEVFNFVAGDTLLAQPIQSLAVSNGSYLADSLLTGMYHVRFTPDPVLFPGVAPLYYTSGDTWTTAQAIGLPCFLDNGNINSNTLSVLGGGGVITGNIIIDTNYLKAPTQVMENALVKLFNSTNDVIAFTYTDVNGNYQFLNVPTGNYYILLDLPYIPQLNQHSITVIGDQIVNGADFSVMLDGISAVDNIVLGLEDSAEIIVSIYPNPASDRILVTTGGSMHYSISGVNGQTVLNGMLSLGTNEINTSELTEGVYFVQLDNLPPQKLVIRK